MQLPFDKLYLASGVASVVVLAAVIFCFFIIYCFSSRKEGSFLATLVTVIAVALSVTLLLLFPIDVYNASQSPLNLVAGRTRIISIAYYVLFGCIIGVSVLLVPFAYFYYEDALDEEVSKMKRIGTALKFTVVLLIALAIILVIGIFVQGDAPSTEENSDIKQFLADIIDSENWAESSIMFTVFALTIFGFFFYLTYTAFGFMILPIGFMRGRKRIEDEQREIENELEKTSRAKGQVEEHLSHSNHSRSSRNALGHLQDHQLDLEEKAERLKQMESCCLKCVECLSPIQLLFGVIFFALSLLIIVATCLTQVDRLMHSACGIKCGFVLKQSTLPNPLDLLLTYSSMYFPLDYVTFTIIIGYILYATIYTITDLGIRILWIKLYSIRWRKTAPQGMLCAAFILVFCSLCINIELLAMAPQYSTFGSRKHNGKFCSMEDGSEDCPMTALATLVNRISLSFSIFGIIFYFASWAFIVAVAIGSLIAVCRRTKSNLDVEEDDELDDFDFA